MSYFPAIPAANDDPSVSQGQIQTNFSTLNSAINLNHVDLGTGVNQAGKHKFVEMPNQAAVPATLATEGTIYTKAVSGVSQEFYTPDATANEYQMTRTITTKFTLLGTNTNYQVGPPSLFGGWSFLPGGMLFQYGFLANPVNGNVITFPVQFTNVPYSVTVSAVRSNTQDKTISISNGTVGTSSFALILSSSSTPDGVYWMAIGV